jgi:hypothetical protein
MLPWMRVAQDVPSEASARWTANRSQWPEEIRFVARFPGAIVRAERDCVGLQRIGSSSGEGVLVRLSFDGSSPEVMPEGFERQAGVHNFFIGNDTEKWATGVPAFAHVRYRDVYPGIDLVLGERDGRLKYDLEVAAGADLDALVLRFEGIQSVRVNENRVPEVVTSLGPIEHLPGRSWQVLASGEQRAVTCIWRRTSAHTLSVEVPGRDPSLPLVIDPELLWSTYLGSAGSHVGDWANRVAYDPTGHVVVAGTTDGPSTFPETPGAYQYLAGERELGVSLAGLAAALAP